MKILYYIYNKIKNDKNYNKHQNYDTKRKKRVYP